jgi:septum formation protein
VLAVDTEVVIGGRVLGKAADRDAARARLEALSGRTHSVLSGVVVLGAPRGSHAGDEPGEREATKGGGGEGPEVSGVARSEVTFRALDAATLERYLESGEWRDRAGAYAIQGLGSMLVERIEGDFSNVVGLPLGLLIELLREPSVGAGGSPPQGGK